MTTIHKTSNTARAFMPEDYGELLITTAQDLSTVLQTTTVTHSEGNRYHIPIVQEDAAAAWYEEGADIDITKATLSEEVVTPAKLAGLAKISNELVADSDPAAAQIIGQSLARSLAVKIDEAFFSTDQGTGNAPKGIGALADSAVTTVAAGSKWSNIDPFIEAIFKVAAAHAKITAFIANPEDAETLAKLKRETGSNEPLLAPDANSATRRSISGVDLHTAAAVPKGIVYGIDKSRVVTVMRKGTEVTFDSSAFFASDSAAVRAICRIGFGYAHPKSIARIKLTGATAHQ